VSTVSSFITAAIHARTEAARKVERFVSMRSECTTVTG
jgi:hypothetical protein